MRMTHALSRDRKKTARLRGSLGTPFLSGEQTYLEPLTPRHFSADYARWLNDSVVCRENRHGVFPYTERDLEAYLSVSQRQRDAIQLAIRYRRDGRHIGNVGLVNLSWPDRSVEIAILIGDRRAWGRGIGLEVCRLLRDYAFKKLNLHRVWMGILQSNEPMLHIARRLGMRQEGRFKDFIYKEGRYVDVTQWYALNPDEKRGRSS